MLKESLVCSALCVDAVALLVVVVVVPVDADIEDAAGKSTIRLVDKVTTIRSMSNTS